MSTTTSLIILFLSTLPLHPIPSFARGHLTPSALGFPIALTLIPREAFSTQTPKSWEVARCVQYLVWVWVGVWVWGGLRRTVLRIKKGSLRLDPKPEPEPKAKAGEGDGEGELKPEAGDVGKGDRVNITTTSIPTTTNLKINLPTVPTTNTTTGSYTPNPLLTAIILHLISWRLSTTLMLDLPGGWAYPFDTTTLIGLGVGLISAWGEIRRLLRITGLAGGKWSCH
jgi:hypothetical protein